MCKDLKGKNTLSTPHQIQGGENVRAEICKCGSVQLHLGPMSLRYTREAFEELYQLVNGIHARLRPMKETGPLDEKSGSSLSQNVLDFLQNKGPRGEA